MASLKLPIALSHSFLSKEAFPLSMTASASTSLVGSGVSSRRVRLRVPFSQDLFKCRYELAKIRVKTIMADI
jgi:hypothetical protein